MSPLAAATRNAVEQIATQLVTVLMSDPLSGPRRI
jgi:hypothetical protein